MTNDDSTVHIDHADDQMVRGLTALYCEEYMGRSVPTTRQVAAMRKALERFTHRLEEPTGRFAEVKDATGRSWFRMYPVDKSFPFAFPLGSKCWAKDGAITTGWHTWDSLCAVEVVDPGRDG